MTSDLSIRAAALDDLPFIMATERLPGYDHKLGRWSADEHQAALARPDHAYLIGESAQERLAFAILMDLDDPSGNARLKRIAVAQPGNGIGRRFLVDVADQAFALPAIHRLWFNVLFDNARARHVYGLCGFRAEGVKREAYLRPDGVRIDLVLMAITRPEWQNIRAAAVL